MEEIPKIISVDDHVIEPPHVWMDRLPAKYREVGPRVERHPLGEMSFVGGKFAHQPGTEGPPCDWWRYEDKLIPHTRLAAAVGFDRDDVKITAITYEEMRKGCWDPVARIADMDANWTEAQMCFPSFPRFCGQTFLEAEDRELALLCVQAYNDWMVEEWCGDSGGRLIPLTIIPLWDAQLAADEVRRNAARGVHAVCFSEIPPYLGLPSIHSGEWDPFFAACAETATVVCMHIGSSSKMPSTSTDAPPAVGSTLTFGNAMSSLVDFLMSGVLVRFPQLTLCYSEGQIGWLPYILERADKVWEENRGWNGVYGVIPERPSSYYERQVYGCFFDDEHGLTRASLEKIKVDNICFETDYPHSDSTWPNSKETAAKLMGHLDSDEIRKLVRGNAIRMLSLDATP